MKYEFPTKALEEVAELKGGYAFKSKDYRDSGRFVLRTVNISNEGRITREGATFVSEEHAREFERFELRTNDTLFVMVGATLGKTGLVKEEDLPALLNQNMWVIRAKDRVADPVFLHFAFNIASQDLLGWASGAAREFVRRDDYRKLTLPFPPLAVQREISATLGAIDDKIANNRALAADLEAMARAIFKSWFVDFDPVKAKMEGRTPTGMDAETAALFPDELVESELGLIPKGWEASCLTDAFELNPRYTLKKGMPAPYLEMSNVPVRGHVPDEVVPREFSSGTKFQNGDTLLARITPCLENGKAAHVDFLNNGQVAWGSTEFIVLRAKPPVPSYFGYLLCRLDAFREHAISSMTGTSGRQRVQPDSLARWRLALPGKSICRKFDHIIDPLRAKIRQLGDESQELAQLRDALLPRLISGKLRLPEAETVTGQEMAE
ncbi:restriction endonuclease subunit S [Halioxenophilus aromaticivorans]|uniref:Restriction endonuclease subunit S n=1 Tax=Halioxenophilus aromaticivorans TaxID=1306992 RepID=A0AAV3U7F6_9ALTE